MVGSCFPVKNKGKGKAVGRVGGGDRQRNRQAHAFVNTTLQQNYPLVSPRKKKTQIPKKKPKRASLIFREYFRGFFVAFDFSGFQNFGPGGIVSVFLLEILVPAISGLCSRPGRSRFQPCLAFWISLFFFLFAIFLALLYSSILDCS